MHSFSCQNCRQLVFFENSRCLRCDTPLGFSPDLMSLLALRRVDDSFRSWIDEDPGAVSYRRCANSRLAACNWLVVDDADLCVCCELTRTRPDDDDTDAMVAFADTEGAKRRLVFQLLDLGLPVARYDDETGPV